MTKEKGQKDRFPIALLWLLPAFVVAIYLLRLLAFVRFLLPLVVIAVLAWLLFSAVRKMIKNHQYNKSLEGQVMEKIEFCRQEHETEEDALADIDNNIKELESDLMATGPEITGRDRIIHLLRSFREERVLRQAKKEFFESCVRQLEQVLIKYRLNNSLQERQKHLEELRKNRGLSPGEMEMIRQDIRLESDYVNSIGRLSKNMSASKVLTEAEQYKLELEEITALLKNKAD